MRQGDIFWLDLPDPKGSAPGFRRPVIVVQNDVFNASRIRTVVCCALTTNVSLAIAPGNVLLRKGEGNLEKSSVVNVSQIVTADRSDLKEKIGTLSAERVRRIVAGLAVVFEPREL
jgi:mRNA interferase MazF